MSDLYGYGPDCCGSDDSAYGPDLAAGRPQEPRSDPAPAVPTDRKRSALRIDLRAGIVDMSSIPLALLYGTESGEYRRALDMATDNGCSWSTTLLPGILVVNRLRMAGGAA